MTTTRQTMKRLPLLALCFVVLCVSLTWQQVQGEDDFLCVEPASPTPFSGGILLDLIVGRQPSMIIPLVDIKTLELAVAEAYGGLMPTTASNCALESVILTVPEIEEGDDEEMVSASLTVSAKLTGICTSCVMEGGLFKNIVEVEVENTDEDGVEETEEEEEDDNDQGEDGRRRHLRKQSSPTLRDNNSNHQMESIRSLQSTCTCSTPLMSDFMGVMTEKVFELIEGGSLTSIESLEGGTELLTSTYTLTFCGASNDTIITEESVAIMQDVFDTVYRELVLDGNGTCSGDDSYFTSIISIDFMTPDPEDVNSAPPIEVVLQGTCTEDDCSYDSGLFGNCTETDFLTTYQEALTTYETMTGTILVGDACELTTAESDNLTDDKDTTTTTDDESPSPSAGPSSASPSAGPSAGPTTGPTAAPTKSNPACLDDGSVNPNKNVNTGTYCDSCTQEQTLELECGKKYDCQCLADTITLWKDGCNTNQATDLEILWDDNNCDTPEPTPAPTTSAPTMINPGCLLNGNVDSTMNSGVYCETCSQEQTLELECPDYDCDCVMATALLWRRDCDERATSISGYWLSNCVTPNPSTPPPTPSEAPPPGDNPACRSNGSTVPAWNNRQYCENCSLEQMAILECGEFTCGFNECACLGRLDNGNLLGNCPLDWDAETITWKGNELLPSEEQVINCCSNLPGFS